MSGLVGGIDDAHGPEGWALRFLYAGVVRVLLHPALPAEYLAIARSIPLDTHVNDREHLGSIHNASDVGMYRAQCLPGSRSLIADFRAHLPPIYLGR
jgi:hypothetical protein